MVASLATSVFPSVAAAQAEYNGPAVVPPADVYVSRADGLHFADPPSERPDFWNEAVGAMEAWNEVGGIPLAFRRTARAGSADVEFRWIRRFEANQAGTTDWRTDGEGWLTAARVTLATEHEGGRSMSDEFLRLVALHELGHVIGLPHSDDPSDVMHPGNRNMEVSYRDIRSARQLYERLESERVTVP